MQNAAARLWSARAWPLAAFALAACTQTAPLPAKAVALNRDGAAALAAGDLQTAEARVALALEYSPRFTEAWVNLGLIELSRGNFERAARDFVRARDLNPDLPAPHHALGLLADRQDRAAEAEAHYRAALRVDPGFAPARFNLGNRLLSRGAWEEAREQYLRLTQVAPEFAQGWTGLCETLLRLDRIEEAAQRLAAAIQRLGPNPALAILDARIRLQRHAFAEAADRLEALTHNEDRTQAAQALAWLAVARLALGDAGGAAAAAIQAESMAPEDPVARYALRASRERGAGP